MTLPALPALPAEVLGCIAHAALAAEDNDVRAWVRLSLVCRTWRDSLRGAQRKSYVELCELLQLPPCPRQRHVCSLCRHPCVHAMSHCPCAGARCV